MSSAVETDWPPSAVISSPSVRPALAAGEPEGPGDAHAARAALAAAEAAESAEAPGAAALARGADLHAEEGGGADVHVSRGSARLDLLGDGQRLVDRDGVGLLRVAAGAALAGRRLERVSAEAAVSIPITWP
jgi:hypothetical protein